MNGYTKPKKRERKSKLDNFYQIIYDLLINQNTQVFFYKRVLWQYLKDNHGLECSASHFRKWISQHEEFDKYFNGRTNRTVNGKIRNNMTIIGQSKERLVWELRHNWIGRKICIIP